VHGQHTPFVELQVEQQSDAEQCHLDEVRSRQIGDPVRAQIDARWTNEHHEEGGNHQKPDTPPATTVEVEEWLCAFQKTLEAPFFEHISF
jgi:hypothetical protein